MNRKLSIIALSILLLSVTACSSNTTTSSNDPASQSAITTENSAPDQADGNKPWGEGASDQMQGERADLTGEVSEISGNKVTLKVIEMPTFNRNNTRSQGSPGKSNGETPKSTENDNGANAKRNNSHNVSNNSNTAPNSDQPLGDGQPRQRAQQYTGETKTITIPDGVTISSMSRKNDGNDSKALSISDIKQGNILQIWYSDEAKEVISKVSVMEAMFGGVSPSDNK